MRVHTFDATTDAFAYTDGTSTTKRFVWTEFDSLADLMEASGPARYNRADLVRYKTEYVLVDRRDRRGRTRKVTVPKSVPIPKPDYEPWLAAEMDMADAYTFGEHFRTLRATNLSLVEGRAQPATVEAYEQLRGKIDQMPIPGGDSQITTRRRRAWSDSDGEPDADRVNQQHEHFLSQNRRGKPHRMIRLGINITQGMFDGQEAYVRVAAECAAAADHLERLGYPVQILGLCLVYNTSSADHRAGHLDQFTCHTWPVKQPTEPMDIQRVLSMASPGLHRWHIRDALRYPGFSLPTPPEALERIGLDHVFGEREMTWAEAWAAIAGGIAGEPIDATPAEELEVKINKPKEPPVPVAAAPEPPPAPEATPAEEVSESDSEAPGGSLAEAMDQAKQEPAAEEAPAQELSDDPSAEGERGEETTPDQADGEALKPTDEEDADAITPGDEPDPEGIPNGEAAGPDDPTSDEASQKAGDEQGESDEEGDQDGAEEGESNQEDDQPGTVEGDEQSDEEGEDAEGTDDQDEEGDAPGESEEEGDDHEADEPDEPEQDQEVEGAADESPETGDEPNEPEPTPEGDTEDESDEGEEATDEEADEPEEEDPELEAVRQMIQAAAEKSKQQAAEARRLAEQMEAQAEDWTKALAALDSLKKRKK